MHACPCQYEGSLATDPSPYHAGSQPKRKAAYDGICSALGIHQSQSHPRLRGLQSDLNHANDLIINGLSLSSWERNASWTQKFKSYVMDKCPTLATGGSIARAVTHDVVALAFLAHVDKTNPGKKTVVSSARRALNMLRGFMGHQSLHNHAQSNLLARASTREVVTTVRQSAGIPPVMLASLISSWGYSTTWWERQTVLMVIVGFITLSRGAGVVSCLSDGVSWISCGARSCGTQKTSAPQSETGAKAAKTPPV